MQSTPQTPSYPGFAGKVGRTREESTPHWDIPAQAAAGSPNIVIIYLDDMGYSDIGCYGSEIETPHIDALANRGIRFNHYTTHPICSPARAALLTGRNAHAVATGWLSNNNPGFPGYTGNIPFDAATLPEVLQSAGYATVGVGKWHNSTNGAVPNKTWPTQRGFERFYGFLEGETSYFFPARLVQNNMVIPLDSYPADYYSTDDWTDRAIGYVKEIRHDRPKQPFLLYLAHNAMHGPLQAKEGDLAKYRGKYDAGWDALRAQRLVKQKALGMVPDDTVLAPRDPSVPAWDGLPADQRALFARHMETYAAMLDCVDQNVGKLVELLVQLGELDNTIFVLSADNGGTSSGGPAGAIHFNRRFAGLPGFEVEHSLTRADWIGSGRVNPLYPTGWAQLSNTPFPAYKTQTGAGGRRVACIVSWPTKLTDSGAIRSQFAHVTDLMPTLLDLAGVSPPAMSHGMPAKELQGKSQRQVLLDARSPDARTEQYFECWAHRAYFRDGWVAVSIQKMGEAIDFDNWTLHRQATDFSEIEDLAKQFPDKLKELVDAFDKDAWANLVYPLDNRRPVQKFQQIPPHERPAPVSSRVFLRGAQTVNRASIAPLLSDRNFTVTVNLVQGAQDEGVLFALGDVAGGMVMYIEHSLLHLFYNGYGEFIHLEAMPMPPGQHAVALEYEALGERKGRGRLLLNGHAAHEWQDLSPTLMVGFHEGFDIGIDRRAPVEWELFERRGNFPYSGKIDSVVVDSRAFAPGSAFAIG
jgi:arylsulfatase A-like enzyme